jgi:rhodanese-related sulfurtransferase
MLARISRDEVKEKIGRNDRFVLVEALPPFMYREGHLPGAVDIPPGHVEELAPDLVPDRSMEVVVYCSSPT